MGKDESDVKCFFTPSKLKEAFNKEQQDFIMKNARNVSKSGERDEFSSERKPLNIHRSKI